MKAIKTDIVVERKLVAVIAGKGFVYFPKSGGGIGYVDTYGKIQMSLYSTLEDALSQEVGTPIYEGDAVTLQF